MLVVHAAWSGHGLVLWGEDSSLPAEAGAGRAPRRHPFAAPAAELMAALAVTMGEDAFTERFAEIAAQGVRSEAELLLPGSAKGPLPSPESGREPAVARPRVARWLVPTLMIDALAALRLLDLVSAARSDTRHELTGTMRYLATVSTYAGDLVRRGRVLPGLVAEGGGHAARWRPVITGRDSALFRELAAAMPPACRAVGGERASALVLREAVGALADAGVRASGPDPLLPPRRGRRTRAERWLAALTGDDAAAVGDEVAGELGAALDAWFEAASRGDGPVRVCFRLIEPVPEFGDEPAPDRWRVELALQSAEDPSLYVPAETIWAGEPVPGFPGHPEEELLAGLGRAVRLYPELGGALRVRRPAEIGLDTAGAFEFLRRAAPLLQEAGFGVRLPAWAGRSRLGLRLTTRSRQASRSAASQGFGLREIVDFRFDLAIGDQTVSEEELAELARLKVPLVRVRGQWVELDERQLNAALKAVEGRRRGEMTVGEVIQEVVAGGDDDLPLVAVDADGPLGDLLSGQADRRLAAIATPPGFAGTLRPYQERGLAWLSFLSELGLGAVLADDMGLGKCILPESPVFADGTLMEAHEIWNRFAQEITFDGEGEWTAPSRPITTTSLADSGRMVEGKITRLYRQHVREKLRRIRLDDGSEIVVTKRHHLLSLHGWTKDFTLGDRVCVPQKLIWQGSPVDPDLTILLAWQISEGYEDRKASLRITQKNRAVLDSLIDRIHAVGTRFGLVMNKPTIRPTRDVHDLRMCSIDYFSFLAEHGYVWGHRSAAKRIPDLIMTADDDTVRLFLREYFTAEASVLSNMRTVEISSASPWLMKQLAALLRRFGIWLRTTEKMKCATNGTKTMRPYQIGLIGGPSLRVFRDVIGFSDAEKQKRLRSLCERPANTNTEGIPAADLLSHAYSLTRIPKRHFGVGTVYFAGTQELSRTSADAALSAMDRILSGAAAREYRKRPQTRWTTSVNASYAALDVAGLSAIRDELAGRTQREVFYPRIVSIEEFGYEGYVYDFEVAEHHNFVAGGLLCHNTAQTLALLLAEPRDDRLGATLLACPMSLVGNWQREAERFTPSLNLYVHHGARRKRDDELTEAVGKADLVITTYGTALRDREELARFDWARVVCDEAQAIKNSASRQAQAVRSFGASSRLALTGTPVENHLAELWSIMEFCNPGLLGSRQRFRRRFQEPIEAQGDERAAQALKRATGPFVLRRLKTDKSIIDDLPEKLEMKVWCTLTQEQASLYQAVVDDMLARIDDSEGIERRGNVLAAMARLKQVCNHPAHLLKDGTRLAGRSGKLARLEELAEEIVDDGEKALLFTQYAEFGAMLQPYLSARLDRPVLWLHGGLPKSRRDRLVERFQGDDEPMLFLLSLKAAGTGLNLTAASHVIHIDRWWNPAVEDQATDRAFRIGQRKNVQVRKFVCVGTLEERIDQMIERKKALAERVVGTGEDWLTDLSTDELREVFRLSSEAVS